MANLLPLTVREYNDGKIRAALDGRARNGNPLGRAAGPAPIPTYRVASKALEDASPNRRVTEWVNRYSETAPVDLSQARRRLE